MEQMNICIIGHASTRTVNNPDGDNYDIVDLKVHKKSAELFREWADAVLFAAFDTTAAKLRGEIKAKASFSDTRVIHTRPTGGFVAKNRFDLPAKMPLSWPEVAEAIARREVAPAEELRAEIERLLGQSLPEAMKIACRAAVARASANPRELSKILNHLKVKTEQMSNNTNIQNEKAAS
jgi:hypothetical protein